jgi:protein-S-isoprenylcysteine O-methyltransferase Ste14
VSTLATQRGAAVVPIPPPAFYGAGFAVSLVLQHWLPLGFHRPSVVVIVGVVLFAAGVALALAGVVTVLRHRTTIVPHRPVSTLVTDGPYRISRNPMYAGLAVAYLGGTLLAGTWWGLILAPLVAFVVFRLAIQPEERYLAERYPTEYAAYRHRARRWL